LQPRWPWWNEGPDRGSGDGIEGGFPRLAAAKRAAKAEEIGPKGEERRHMLCSERSGKTDGQAFGLGGGYKPGEHLKAEVVE
jgi:hypothetical protein